MRQDRRAAPQAIIGRFVIINQSWRILALLRGILINDQSGAERSGAERKNLFYFLDSRNPDAMVSLSGRNPTQTFFRSNAMAAAEFVLNAVRESELNLSRQQVRAMVRDFKTNVRYMGKRAAVRELHIDICDMQETEFGAPPVIRA